MSRVVVIGAGLAGLTAAIRLLEQGTAVTMVAKGPGGMQLSQGTFDLLGYAVGRLDHPLDGITRLPDGHVYRILGAAHVRKAFLWLRSHLPLVGSPDENLLLPTALGALRPTALAPASLAAADVRLHQSFAVVGVRQVRDFQADLIAGNLARQRLGMTPLAASCAWVDFAPRLGEADLSPVHLAEALDNPATAQAFGTMVRAAARSGDVVLVPAIIGRHNPDAWQHFAEAVQRPVAEIALQPPSIPGLRLFASLLSTARSLGLRYLQGARVSRFEADGGQITAIHVAAAGHPKRVACDGLVHAPGGFESGGLVVDSYGAIREPLFGLALTKSRIDGLVDDDYWAPRRIYEVGVPVDTSLRPIGCKFANLVVAGGILSGAQRQREKSGDGIALASAIGAADTLLGCLR